MELPKPIKDFIQVFSKLPGIGPRQTTRLAFWLLHQKKETQHDFYHAFINLFSKTQICPNCFFISEKDSSKQENQLCKICQDSQRDQSVICVVEKETDLISIENTNKYKGLYHVLGGLISEIDESRKEKLTIKQLLTRIKTNKKVKEIILALNPNSEGNLTTYYIEKAIKTINPNIKITKLGRGLPQGGEVEFADAETLVNALEGRK
ncbi:MAG: recombination mediator RecR [Candidatus Pacebacteria bacterium]|nr:recombination mediator RecR [Candidatus Paceibacterota bacterium]MDD5535330.1 recombination mediator RecR [Candidatus Paceibacterota bacterium]